MPDSQSSEPGLESPLLQFRSLGILFSPRHPISFGYINEYLSIDGGGNVCVKSLSVIAAGLECFQEKPRWCRIEQVCQGRKSVKRFETCLFFQKSLH